MLLVNSYYYNIMKILFNLKIYIYLLKNIAYIQIIFITTKHVTCSFYINTF